MSFSPKKTRVNEEISTKILFFFCVSGFACSTLVYTCHSRLCLERWKFPHSEIFTKSLVCWGFSGQKESKPDRNPKTFNQEAKVAFIALSRSVLFSPLTSHTQIFAGAQLHECQATSTKKVYMLSADIQDWAPSAYTAELLAASYYTFCSRENLFQITDFFFFACANVFKWVHTGETVSRMKLKNWRIWGLAWEPFVEYRHLLPVMVFL